MRKSTGKDKVINVEVMIDPSRAIDPEGIFNDNAMVVDYLNALLISAPPPPSLDFSEIRFVHPTADDNSSYSAPGFMTVDNLINFESERQRIESTELKRENDELRLKVARLVAQLNEIECSLDTIISENNSLKSRADYLQNQLKISDKVAKNATRRLQAATAALRDKTDEAKTDQPVLSAIPEELNEVLPEPVAMAVLESVAPLAIMAELTELIEEEPVLDLVSQDIVADIPELQENEGAAQIETLNERPAVIMTEKTPEPVLPQKTPTKFFSTASSAIDMERAIISRPVTADDQIRKKPEHKVTIISQKRTLHDDSFQRHRSIIKQQQQVKQFKLFKETEQAETVITQNHEEYKIPDKKIEPIPEPIIQEPAAGAAAAPEPEPPADKELLQTTPADESAVGAVAAPKIFVRQHIKNYEVIQEEADGAAPKLTHDIVS